MDILYCEKFVASGVYIYYQFKEVYLEMLQMIYFCTFQQRQVLWLFKILKEKMLYLYLRHQIYTSIDERQELLITYLIQGLNYLSQRIKLNQFQMKLIEVFMMHHLFLEVLLIVKNKSQEVEHLKFIYHQN
ncbi:unnamed protein product [Paramecium sonneborni]|uniref:Uncharacterized protein n=1 Tax=Paramecium sonneborni TaxID=65129 RepID=A0A8S1M588_9CILI|nr:unnamed protein product [Paramecium sonneborni]